MRIKKEYLKRALESVKKVKIYNEEKNCVPKEYNGYISSFGASIRQAGLLATVLFFENTSSSAAQDRSKVLRAIEYILELPQNSLKDNLDREKIEMAAVALKLAIRTYPMKKNCGENENG
jgi:CRISPR-associated protein Cmr5